MRLFVGPRNIVYGTRHAEWEAPCGARGHEDGRGLEGGGGALRARGALMVGGGLEVGGARLTVEGALRGRAASRTPGAVKGARPSGP